MKKMGAPINEDRVKAQLEGRITYTGKPCRNCNTTEKYVSNFVCVKCLAIRNKSKSKRGKNE